MRELQLVYPKEWKKAGDELEDITSAIEEGKLSPAEKKGNDLTARYRELEIMSVTKSNLGAAQDNIKTAKKDDAEKKAPKTFGVATLKYQNAEKLIKANPKNTEAIRRASEDATRESIHLVDVTHKVNAGNTEDLVLVTERQQRTISGLRTEASSTEQELQQSQEQLTEAEQQRAALAQKQTELEKTQNLSATAEKIRRQFKPNEAEVFTQSGKLMVRLKALQFPSSQATLGPKNQAFLKRVEAALGGVDASKITVEGHSDSTGKAETNRVLSEKRAAAVESYLINSGTVEKNQVESIGMGPDSPISDNNTASGRAQNRRIDLVIETE